MFDTHISKVVSIINRINECGKESKEYIIYVTDFRFLKEILAAAVLSNILSSKCVFDFAIQPIANHTESKLDKMFISVQQIHDKCC